MAEPVRVLSAGMVGSGSTFLYNVTRDILLTDKTYPTVAVYSDEWNPRFAGRNHLVVKSHWGVRALAPLAERGLLLPVVSVRHPGDSVCSDVERFGFTFEFALARVQLSLKFSGILRQMPDALTFRYEDRFAANPRTAPLLARVFGIKIDAQALEAIGRKYAADNVRAYAARLDTVPGLMRSSDNPHDAWCPTTQIHRGHIGKQTSGRWRNLPPDKRAMIDEACGEEAASFGYDCVA